MTQSWKKGRGKLGPLQPLLGSWVAESDSPRGPLRCRRELAPILGGKYLRLDVRWEFGAAGKAGAKSGKAARTGAAAEAAEAGPGAAVAYEEHAVIGVGDDGNLRFWSFTSDGKRSEGWLADVTDIHPEAVGFEAEMPAGRARMAYWPDEGGGFRWVVESKTKKGWNRFVEHAYRQADGG